MDALRETATDAQLAPFSLQTVDQGSGRGARVLSVAPAGGMHARVLVDRGLDIAAAWFGGLPLAWMSGVGEQPFGHADSGEGWHDGWAGGLVTTCGLRNVGVPSEGHGRHGRYSDQPVDELSIKREVGRSGSGVIVIEGVIREAIGLGRGLVVRRRITFALWSGSVEIEDTTVNETAERVQAPLLYHVNVGAPFLDAESVPLVRETDAFRPAANIRAMGGPEDAPDVVSQLAFPVPADGWSEVAIDSLRLGLRLRVGWDAEVMPNLFAWQRRTPGSYVTALEPANCTVDGRFADRESGIAPWLESGEIRRTGLRIVVDSIPREAASIHD